MLTQVISIANSFVGRALCAGLTTLVLVSTLANPSFTELSQKDLPGASVVTDDGVHAELQLYQQSKSREDQPESGSRISARMIAVPDPVICPAGEHSVVNLQSSHFTSSLLYTLTTSADL